MAQFNALRQLRRRDRHRRIAPSQTIDLHARQPRMQMVCGDVSNLRGGERLAGVYEHGAVQEVILSEDEGIVAQKRLNGCRRRHHPQSHSPELAADDGLRPLSLEP